MLNNIRFFWSKCLLTGVDESLSFAERLKIELLNQFVMVGTPLLFTHITISLFNNNSKLDLKIASIWLSILGTSMLLNGLKKYVTARLLLIIVGATFLFLLHFFFGQNSRLEFLYLVFVIAATYFFEGKLLTISVFFIFVLFLVASVQTFLYPPILQEVIVRENLLSATIGYLLFSVLIVSALTRKVLTENRNYRNIIIEKNAELTQSNKEFKQFNYILSHDIKEPIRSIVSFSNLLKRKGGEEKDRQDYLNFVIQSGTQLNKLVDDIQTFQAIDYHPIVIEEINWKRFSISLQKYLHPLIEEKKGEIELDLPPFSSSEYQLNLILKNLIENGLKYNQSSNPTVKLTGHIEEDKLHIFIKDNGIGFEEKFINKAFTMFKRLERQKSKSSGLGLNIALKAAESLGGSLEILNTEIGKGTTFLLQLPKNKTAS